MPQVAFRLGAEPVFTITVLMYLGLLSGVFLLAREGLRRGWRRLQALELCAWAIVPAVLGGRAACVLESWLAEPSQWGHWSQPWGDGLSLPGALVAGAAGLAMFAGLRRGLSYWEICGAAVPGLALGQALGWLGAAAHGAWAGVPISPARPWAPLMRDLYGTVLPRFPLQYLAAALSLGVWALIHTRVRSDRGRVACYALVTGWGVGALLFAAERRVAVAAGLSAGQIGYALIGLAGVVLALVEMTDKRRRRYPSTQFGSPAVSLE